MGLGRVRGDATIVCACASLLAPGRALRLYWHVGEVLPPRIALRTDKRRRELNRPAPGARTGRTPLPLPTLCTTRRLTP